MLEIMLPNLVPGPAPVQAPAVAQAQAPVVNAPPVVNAQLVAAVVQAPPVAVQQLVGQLQDLFVQHVNIVPASIAMEVEDDNEILKRLFLKRFGRALPEVERNDVDDINMDLIDLTKEGDEEMEDDTTSVFVHLPIVVVKTELTEVVEVDAVLKTLQKTVQIEEKEAPENVIIKANNDTDMSEDRPIESINTVEQVNPLGNVYERKDMTDAELEAEQRAFGEEFGHIVYVPDEFDNEDENAE
jgi:hypothetical protein